MAVLQMELTRHPRSSVTWIRILENGDFEVEYFDYLDDDTGRSGDYAVINVIKKEDVPQMQRLLSNREALGDEEFLEIICQTFDNRGAIEDWCKANNVPCTHVDDLFA